MKHCLIIISLKGIEGYRSGIRVLPYSPVSPFFLDYAEADRFVWMPEGASATPANDDEPFHFPQGAILIYNSYYNQFLP